MGAAGHENKVEVTDDAFLYDERTGLLWDFLELERLGFQMESYCGYFSGSRIDELLYFCKKNPCYHIISTTDADLFVNRYIPGQRFYYLGDGDNNPDLVLNPFLRKSRELFAEEGFAELFAVVSDVNRSHKKK